MTEGALTQRPLSTAGSARLRRHGERLPRAMSCWIATLPSKSCARNIPTTRVFRTSSGSKRVPPRIFRIPTSSPSTISALPMACSTSSWSISPAKTSNRSSVNADVSPYEEGIPLMIQACAGVGYAHRAGLVHCDIKPHNMLVSKDGRLKVTDFGIARALATITPTERNDVVWGSPLYFAPEQASGEAPTPASDVYSLGVVLYELLTARRPSPPPPPTNSRACTSRRARSPSANTSPIFPRARRDRYESSCKRTCRPLPHRRPTRARPA
jgi:hypothetical protein